jgi:hypothetical protein
MPKCQRCRTEDPDRFETPTGAFCRSCWAYLVDHGRRFTE